MQSKSYQRSDTYDLDDIITPYEIEALEELAADLDIDFSKLLKAKGFTPLRKDKGKPKPAPTNFSKILVATNKPNTRNPGSGQIINRANKKVRRDLNSVEREWVEELEKEIKEIREDTKRSRRLPAVPPRREIEELMREAKRRTNKLAKRNYLVLRLMYATGCRRFEIAGIRLADINFDAQTIFVRDGNGDKDRYVLMDKTTNKLLKKYTRSHKLEQSLFGIKGKQINRVVVDIADDSGLSARYEAQDREFTSHSLRHAFATHLYESGVDLYLLKDLLGHRYLTTTRLYVHIGISKRLNSYEAHHPLASAEFHDGDD